MEQRLLQWTKKTITVSRDATMYSLIENEQVDNYFAFVKYIIEYVESTSEYKSLPETQGGYD
jgi:hypothetical protein